MHLCVDLRRLASACAGVHAAAIKVNILDRKSIAEATTSQKRPGGRKKIPGGRVGRGAPAGESRFNNEKSEIKKPRESAGKNKPLRSRPESRSGASFCARPIPTTPRPRATHARPAATPSPFRR